ncbi:MAG: hypothetical protein RJA35_222 [Actinomycetota bacterium]|jgi:8-oxo-dGTP pyrophosphatase MutT (NUDIX family)
MSSNGKGPKVKKHHRPANPESVDHVKHRETARVFLQNPAGELLMMNTHWDPGTGLPPRWLTPGGGIDPGESILAAAVRELFEETGLVVEPEALGELELSLPFKMVWANGQYETGIAHFYRLTVETDFAIDNANWTVDEHRDVIEWRWWKPADLIASGVTVGPPGLLEYLQHHS